MCILVTGGRYFADERLLRDTLDTLHTFNGVTELIHGHCSGADTLADKWATELDTIHIVRCPADWKRYGRAAGPIRNREMLELRPDLVIAFPGGKGTADMVRQSRLAGIEVQTVQYPPLQPPSSKEVLADIDSLYRSLPRP